MRKRASVAAAAQAKAGSAAARPLGAAAATGDLEQSRGPGDVAHLISDDSDSDFAAI